MLMNETQDGVATPAHPLFLANVGSGLAPYFESKPTECFLQPFGALSVRTAELWESFI